MRRRGVFFSLLGVSTAVAAYCCDPWGLPVQQVFIQVGQSVSGVLRASSLAVARHQLQLNTTFIDGVTQTSASMQRATSAQRVMGDGWLTVQQSMETQRHAAEAVEQSKAPPQIETTVTDGVLAGEMAAVVTDKVKQYDLDWSNRYLSKTPQDIGRTVIERHRPYCAPQDVERGLCAQAAIPALQNADLTVNSIYQPGSGQYDTLSDQEHAAALAFVQNLTQPVAYSPPAGKSVTGANGALSADLASDQSTLALAAHSFHVQIAERTRRHP